MDDIEQGREITVESLGSHHNVSEVSPNYSGCRRDRVPRPVERRCVGEVVVG
jgi:hypothetical protein